MIPNLKNMNLILFILLTLLSCNNKASDSPPAVLTGADQLPLYIHSLTGKKIGLVVNQTSVINKVHLVDTLISRGVNVHKIFAPEHGFRGEADAGASIANGIDVRSGAPIISLYGKNKKPLPADLKDLDVLVFDIQDVGVRFYTYISTLSLVMEACAENEIPLIVLDRPNPNRHRIDGPILESQFSSFVGMHQVPILYGMTIGEYGNMVNQEGWLAEGVKCDYKVIPCKNLTKSTRYHLPIKPSPNLPNAKSIYLYPSLCFFEGTSFSVGRGTDQQFQIYGHPEWEGSYTFIPVVGPGAKYPKHENKECRGTNLSNLSEEVLAAENLLNLDYLMQAYQSFDQEESFFLENNFIDKLAGTDQLRKQIIAGQSETEIRATWEEGLEDFKKLRAKHLLYD